MRADSHLHGQGVAPRGEMVMSESTDPTGTAPTPLTKEERLELANQLYREYHTRCFWHCPRELVITEDLISLVIDGLRKHGGRRGFMLSSKLRQRQPVEPNPKRDLPECP
jgi:hypothetical protein